MLKAKIKFERREDGGLLADSDEIPGFVLSNSNPLLVLAEIKPAIEAIAKSLYGEKAKMAIVLERPPL